MVLNHGQTGLEQSQRAIPGIRAWHSWQSHQWGPVHCRTRKTLMCPFRKPLEQGVRVSSLFLWAWFSVTVHPPWMLQNLTGCTLIAIQAVFILGSKNYQIGSSRKEGEYCTCFCEILSFVFIFKIFLLLTCCTKAM